MVRKTSQNGKGNVKICPMTQPIQKKKYRLYLDESGDHTYNLLDNDGHRYLALLGVWFLQGDEYNQFAENLEQFKAGLFGQRPDEPVTLHRKDIINRRGPFGILNDPVIETRFNEGLLTVIEQAQFKVACVLIDKKKLQDEYISPFHPYHFGLALMLERYGGWLNYKTVIGDVMAESRGSEENLQLQQAYLRFHKSGTTYFKHEVSQRVLTSTSIKFRTKLANIAGLQLADLLAHPVRQMLLLDKNRIADPGDVFWKKICKVIEGKFNRNEWSGQVNGYGKIWL